MSAFKLLQTWRNAMTSHEFTDAQQLMADHPDTFRAPPLSTVLNVGVGDIVKVCAGRERFWVEIAAIDGAEIIGWVDNDLYFTDEHGLEYDDEVVFEHRHIYDVIFASLDDHASRH